MGRVCFLVAVVMLAAATPYATAQERDEPSMEPEGSFGPVIVIEEIEVVGNHTTATRLIRRALPFAKGDALRAGDPRLSAARYKVLALGYFRDVALKLSRGSRRGQVVLTVVVSERGTVVLERMYFGRTDATPWWGGLDLTERNFFGSGIGVGGAFLFAGEGEVEGASAQKAFQLRLDDSAIRGSAIGAYLTLSYIDASEPYRVTGDDDDGNPDSFRAFDYSRIGGTVGVTADVTPLSRLIGGVRVELVDANLPDAPTRELPSGELREIDLSLEPDDSRVVTLTMAFDRDTRAHPILPWNGTKTAVVAELGGTWMGGSYNYASVLAQFAKWWPVHGRSHVFSLQVTGGLIAGHAPLFDRLFAGDLNKLMTPRELGLVLSTRSPPGPLGTIFGHSRYGEFGGVVETQYSFRLFRGGRRVYGGDIFFGAGLWGLGSYNDSDDGSSSHAFPLDIFIDAGLRLDTEIGIFELSIANGIGRVPL